MNIDSIIEEENAEKEKLERAREEAAEKVLLKSSRNKYQNHLRNFISEFQERKKRETLEKIALLHQQQKDAAAAPRHLPPNLPPVTAEDLAAAPANMVSKIEMLDKIHNHALLQRLS